MCTDTLMGAIETGSQLAPKMLPLSVIECRFVKSYVLCHCMPHAFIQIIERVDM